NVEALVERKAIAEAHADDAESWDLLARAHLRAATPEALAQAQSHAAEAWNRMAAVRTDDPALALRAAEACRSAAGPTPGAGADEQKASPLLKTAEALYRAAVDRSHAAPDYLEALGEFLHARGRTDEALANWNRMVEPPHDGAEFLARLADILDRF